MSNQLRRIAVIGGSRIPFCRSNSIYANKNQYGHAVGIHPGPG